MKYTHSIRSLLLGASVLGLALQLQAQTPPPVASHYPAGVEGIRAATLPPPGLYLRDYNYFAWANRFPGGPSDFDLFAYVQAPRLIWMTDWKPFGINYGMDILVPFAYQNVDVGPAKFSHFGLGDIQVEPLLLSTSFKQVDLAAGYAFWAPTGNFDPASPTSAGKGFWTHMFTLGGTVYFDEAHSWALSLLNRYEINMEQQQTDITPGQVNTLEFSASKGFGENKLLEVGVSGYYQQQTTEETGPKASDAKARVIGIGPEVDYVIPCIGVLAQARYAFQFDANARPEGGTAALVLTKRF